MTIRDEAFAGQPISALVIDAHTHIGPYYMNGWYQTQGQTSNDAIIRQMDRMGVDCIVTCPHHLILGMAQSADQYAVNAMEEYPDRIYGYIHVAPGEGMDVLRRQLRTYSTHPNFLGMKFLPGYHGGLNQPEYEYAMDFADEAGCPVLCHSWGNSPSLESLAAMVDKRHRVKLLCAHQGGGTADLTHRLARLMQDRPNLYMELCGSLINTMGMVEIAALVGADRMIFGSDLINLDARYDFGRVVFSGLSDSDKRQILGLNFMRLLRGSQLGQIRVRK